MKIIVDVMGGDKKHIPSKKSQETIKSDGWRDAILSQKVERKPVCLFCIRIHRTSRR